AGLVQQAQKVKQGRLTRAGWPGYGHKLPSCDFKIDVADQRHRHVSRQRPRQFLGPQQHRHVPPRRMSTGRTFDALRAGRKAAATAAKKANTPAMANCSQPQSIGMLVGWLVPGKRNVRRPSEYMMAAPSGNPRTHPSPPRIT